jgi:hypothetical protein
MNRIGLRLAIASVAALASIGVYAGVSAATSSSPSMFYGCTAANGRVLRITTNSNVKCQGGQTVVSWSATGPAGAKGATGPAGAKGATGAPGAPGAPAVNPNVLYNSMTVSSNYEWSQCFSCVQMGEFGNDVTLSSYSGTLKHVVVSMSDWDAAAQVGPIAITLTLYNECAANACGNELGLGPVNGDTTGSVIATSTVTVTPTASVSGCNGPTYTAGCAPAFNVTFPFNVPLAPLASASSEDLIYGISYNNNSVDGGLNVNMSYESSSVPSAGADSLPGWLWASLINPPAYNGVGGANGEVTCASNVSTTFALWSAVPTTYMGNCGEDSSTLAGNTAPSVVGNLVPAVEFLSN